MGSTYGNISTKGPTQAALVAWLRSKNIDAFVGAEQNGWVTFSDRQTDGQDMHWAEGLLQSLTLDLACVGIAVTVYDEEVLNLSVARHGRLESRYNSCPGIEMEDPGDDDMLPTIDDAPALLATIGRPAALDDLLQILGMNGAKDYINPLDLHAELAAFIGFSEDAVGFGHRYTLRDKVDLAEDELIRTVAGK
ncbi:hypothetical protein FJV76_10420 [Mesorhizobium sp. WSM4303]|uniref:hypothetical protein n=1 Tax=unclassified Mesorhizobium TaxID=325217 RepID=UPI00115E1D73|nr:MULTISPECIES: hypothetical protein [unclassified Mesorhizobium]TRC97165.1 hypothetical protein FJV77_11555 [Mesorhizobium sp. WSM4306]TRD05407.1 hypothetical protein FJV76_10420 [Mesorhizobium sp. WSM4303]